MLRARLAAGAIGEASCFEASFCSPVAVDASQSMFDPARGGGALLHRGVYPLSLARDLLGPVAEITSTARRGASGVDEEVLIQLRHDSGALSTLRASIAAAGRNDIAIFGTNGSIEVRAPIYRPWAMTESRSTPGNGAPRTDARREALRESALAQASQQRLSGVMGMLRGARATRTIAHYHGNGYAAEAEAVVHDVTAGRTENAVMSLDQSVEVMHLIDQARAAQRWSS